LAKFFTEVVVDKGFGSRYIIAVIMKAIAVVAGLIKWYGIGF
jgi:hypothetical protein